MPSTRSILLDHCVPRSYLDLLQEWSYTVSRLAQHAAVRPPDTHVLAIASTLDAILLTVDKDFLNVLDYPPENFKGIIVARHDHKARSKVEERLRETLETVNPDTLRGVLVIVDSNGYRIFPKPATSIQEDT